MGGRKKNSLSLQQIQNGGLTLQRWKPPKPPALQAILVLSLCNAHVVYKKNINNHHNESKIPEQKQKWNAYRKKVCEKKSLCFERENQMQSSGTVGNLTTGCQSEILLFRERLSYKSVKANATSRKVLRVMLANICLIEAKGISSWQTETTQTSVFMLFLPETLGNLRN